MHEDPTRIMGQPRSPADPVTTARTATCACSSPA